MLLLLVTNLPLLEFECRKDVSQATSPPPPQLPNSPSRACGSTEGLALHTE